MATPAPRDSARIPAPSAQSKPGQRQPARMPAPSGQRQPARMPAEWETQDAVWLAWPHNAETWPGHLAEAENEFEALVCAIANFEPVHVLAPTTEKRDAIERRLAPEVADGRLRLHVVPTNDSWLRDTGPTFVLSAEGTLIGVDWIFNAWGGKYSPWDSDAAVAAAIATLADAEHRTSPLTLEGGALEVDGEGTLLATRSSILDPARNPGISPEKIEAELAEQLGIRKVIWIDAELAGDDTDGHVDNLARFVAPGRVVCAVAPDPQHPNHAALEALRTQLESARDACDRRLEVLELVLPAPIEAGGEPLPASYANFLITNGGVIVPTFGVAADEPALAQLRTCFPDRRVVGVQCRTLVRGFGGPHCLSQQQPRCPGPAQAGAYASG